MLSMRFIAYNDCMYEGNIDVVHMSVTKVSMIVSLTHSTIKELHSHVPPEEM